MDWEEVVEGRGTVGRGGEGDVIYVPSMLPAGHICAGF